jgi:hypothetical protein
MLMDLMGELYRKPEIKLVKKCSEQCNFIIAQELFLIFTVELEMKLQNTNNYKT